MEHLYFIFQNIWNRIGNVRPSDSARYRGRGIIWIFSLLITVLFSISISHAEIKAKEEVSKDDAAKSQAQVTYGKLPLYFIQNDGQVDEKVKFYEKGSGHATFFTKEGVYISLVSGQTPPSSIPSPLMGVEPPGKGGGDIASETKQSNISSPDTSIPPFHKGEQGGITSDLIKLTFLNANPDPEIITEGLQEGKVNYFIGSDPKKWKTNIPTYKAVVYKEIYPGIDIKFYGNNRQMEYDIVVKPDADPSKVRLAYEGIKGLRVTENGDLEIILHSSSPLAGEGRGEGAKIIQRKPHIYQEIDGKRVEVEGQFRIHDNTVIASGAKQSLTPNADATEVRRDRPSGLSTPSSESNQSNPTGLSEQSAESLEIDDSADSVSLAMTTFTYTFEVAAYDRDHALIIDPTLVYSTYLGGSEGDFGSDIAVDAAGNAYVMGWAVSTDFPATLGAYDTTHNGGWWDEFIVKLDSSGSSLVYATYLGGNGYDYGSGITVDASGNLYITGVTYSTNFPTTNGAYNTTYNGNGDVFVVKLNPNGSALLYSTLVGGSNSDGGGGIALDASGNAYVTGDTLSTNFPTISGAFDITPNGGNDVFVIKVNSTGTVLLYSTLIGGASAEQASGISADVSGNVYITGQTSSSDFPTTVGPYDTTYNGSRDVFVAKLDAAGSALSYSTYLGGSGDDFALGISVDASGNAYVTGGTGSSNFPTTPGTYDTIYNGGTYDGFIAKLDAAGSALSYSTYLGGSGDDVALGISVDTSGNAYVAGYTNSSNFPTTPGTYDTTFNGGVDGFVVKLDASGSVLSDSTYIGTSSDDFGANIALDASGNAYVIGRTESSDFPATTGAYDTTPNGMSDVFVAKIAFGTPTITYNPTTDFSIYNGNPNGVWSYGWMPNDFSTFNLYTGARMDTNYNGSPEWYRYEDNYLYTPNIVRNDDNVSHYNVAPGQLALHPSSTNQPSVLRWTAPSDGIYNFAGQFLPGDGNPMIQVGIRQGSNWLWQGVDSGIFNFDRLMIAGESIDFLVYGNFWMGSTPLELTISASDTAASSSILFSDDFNDNYIDTTKWDYGWNRVLESDGIMKVETTVTDGGGRLWSKWIDISPDNTITITRKANLHYSNNYFNGTLRMLFDTNNDGIPDIGFGVEYANDLYATGQYCPRYGFYIIRNSFGWFDGSYLCSKGSDISAPIEPVWDTWFDEKIIYNSSTGVLEYFVNGQKKTELNVGILPPADSYKMQLDFQAWGWWTGHYQYFDDIVVTQNRTTQNVSLDFSNWMKMECGPWENTIEGLKVYGTYFRGGNLIKSKTAYNFIGKELFIKWKVNNGGSFSAYGVGLFGVDLETSFSSPNACCQPYTKAITNDTWYYTRIKINPDKTAQHVTSINDYDINGGTVFASGTKTIPDAQWQMVEKTNIVFEEGDTYAGSNAYFVVGEVITDATPVAINFGSTTTYDFEDGTIPSSFYSTGNWTIANGGYNSSRSLYINTSQTSTISLDVTDAVAVSFKIRVNAPTYSGSGFEIIDQRTYWWAGQDFLCWNDIYFNIYGSGTKTLKWSLFNNGSGGGEAWVDDIKIYSSTPPITPIDSDNDNYTSDVDCNDSNASINPGATEVCNGVDDNCNSQIDEGVLNTYYLKVARKIQLTPEMLDTQGFPKNKAINSLKILKEEEKRPPCCVSTQ